MTMCGHNLLCLALPLLLTLSESQNVPIQQPEQVHIGFGTKLGEINVHWTTIQPCGESGCPKYDPGESYAIFGMSPSKLDQIAKGSAFLFRDEGSEHRNYTMHLATMAGLNEGAEYFYAVGGNITGWSRTFSFRTPPPTGQRPLVYGVYGDLGDFNGQSMPSIKASVGRRELDMVLHVGDFAYNFCDDNGRNGDAFMRDIEEVAASVPYMVSPGNHEDSANFNHYTQRFRNMPSNSGNLSFPSYGSVPNNWWYSWDTGLVHFVAISTEIYFGYPDLVPKQHEWLRADLEAANKNRGRVPWVIVHGHRPLYCSCDSDCKGAATTNRMGLKINGTFRYGLEELFYEYGVDLYLAGHEHDYERMFDVAPFYNKLFEWLSGKTSRRTTDPPATTHIVTGSAGNVESHEPFTLPQPKRSASRVNLFGWSRMIVHNATHLFWEQLLTDIKYPALQDKVVDSTWIVQRHHGPFASHPHRDEAKPEDPVLAGPMHVKSGPVSPSVGECRHVGGRTGPLLCGQGHDVAMMKAMGRWQYTRARLLI